jgi:hypothetical protein
MNLSRNMPYIDPSHYTMIPGGTVPRSTFKTQHSLKTTFDLGYLIPILVMEVLPGDAIQGRMTLFARLGTPLFPIMDALKAETFFFFVPNRLVWDNWRKMMGERKNPADSISYTVPQKQSAASGFVVCSLYDYMGLPTVGQVTAGLTVSANVLPMRGYNLIWNEWFRDQDLQNSLPVPTNDGPDATAYTLQRRNKRQDYFTSARPYPIKGGVETSLPLSGSAPVQGIGFLTAGTTTVGAPGAGLDTQGNALTGWPQYSASNTANLVFRFVSATKQPMIYADLSSATGTTLNALRLAIMTQNLLEKDSRSGTRYTELLRDHFGVTPEDSRLQRPEYCGGGKTNINTSAIPQTAPSSAATNTLGTLGAASTAAGQHEFSYHATEHGFLIGLANVTAEITYQQGMERMWTRQTRYDYYWPAFAHLGEQAIRNDEIYSDGSANDALTFGYQERWAEYRTMRSRITGLFKSTSALNIDEWHAAQQFTALPVLGDTFLQDTPPQTRILAAGATANNMGVLWDSIFDITNTRALPMYSVPGLGSTF